ncbi:MAG: hypothetical protein WHX52_20790 [Anaerolineae bacterium]
MKQKMTSVNERTEAETKQLHNAMSEAWIRREALHHMPTAIEFDGVNSIDILDWVVCEHQAKLAQFCAHFEETAITPQMPTEKQRKSSVSGIRSG